MNIYLNDPVILGSIVGIILFLFIFQLVILFRIKTLFQQILFYMESVSRFFYKLQNSTGIRAKKVQLPQTCQFCKHRLSFIHMSDNKGEAEDFYYKCRLHNIEVQLTDTCKHFEKDDLVS